jgi:basic membrane lipoprotein Med (substrate-binding protein (PBP1-ABC) superfamily)
MPASAARRRTKPLLVTAIAVLIALAIAAAGCGSSKDDWSQPHARPTAVGTLGVGFTDPNRPPTPEATITPRPGSWNAVRPSKDYRVVLLRAGSDRTVDTLATAVTGWAGEVDADVKTVAAKDDADLIPAITKAINLRPDLIISVGNSLVDPLAIATANHLSQQFLTVGSEVAEPTENVTAADWTGASFRGEGLGLPNAYDPTSFTPDRAGRAVRAGVAAVLHGITGVVLRIR